MATKTDYENIVNFFNSIEELEEEKKEELLLNLNNEKDFYFELENGEEYRLIDDNFIEDIFYDSCVKLVEDCYFTKENTILQKYFDYDAFVDDCGYNGYGNHFSSYDGSEEQLDGYYIFRIN